MDLKKLPLANLKRHGGRTAGLAALVALLAFALYGGSLLVTSLQNGLESLEARLGADIVVAPYSAKTQYDLLNDVLLEGTPSSFYMDKDAVDKVAAIDGVEIASSQYYLATMKASCCAMPVQIIGFDPQSDFTVKPWIARSYGGEMRLMDVVVGCNVSGSVGDDILFYKKNCRIVAKLDETGTSMDNAVYATSETVQALIQAAVDMGYDPASHQDPDEVVSIVNVKVADGYKVDDVLGAIKLYVPGVSAVETRTMTSGVADSVGAMSTVIATVFGVVWVLLAIVLVVAFMVVARQRTREFAILRVIGASRKKLRRIVLKESALIGSLGALAGIVAALVIELGFNTALESALGLPFLMPGASIIALYAALAFAVTVLAGCAASYFSAMRLSKVDPGRTLREE